MPNIFYDLQKKGTQHNTNSLHHILSKWGILSKALAMNGLGTIRDLWEMKEMFGKFIAVK